MTKISNQRAYIPDEEINGLDYLPGTDFDQALKTVNFRVQDLGTHYNQVNGVRNFDYNFYAHSGSNPKPADGYFYSNSNEQDPNNITYFVFSKKTARFKDTTNFFESISAENPFDLIIAQKVDINTIFFFRIDSIETFSGYYKLNVSEVFFPNGKELSYTLSYAVFSLKSEGGNANQNLQQVTDEGNSTTNGIIVGGIETPLVRLLEFPFEVDLKAEGLTATRELFAPDEDGTIATREWVGDNLPAVPSFSDQTETNAGLVTDKTIAPNTLSSWWNYQKGLIQTFAQKITFTLGALFTPQAQPTHERGRVYFDDANDCISFMDSISGTSVQVGYEVLMRARNNTGATITNGSVVYISGAIGQNSTIALAQANTLPTSEIIGIVTHDIANNTVGKVCVFGLVNDLNTSSFTDGQMLYLSATVVGGLTSTIPVSPNFVVSLGVVEHAHPTQGKILVRPQRALANNNALGTAQNVPPTENAVKTANDLKQDVLTEVNFGSFMDNGLSTKLTPSLLDSLLARDYITNEAVEILISDLKNLLGGNISVTHSPFNLITMSTLGTWAAFDYRGFASATIGFGLGTGTNPSVTADLSSSLSIIPPLGKKLKGFYFWSNSGVGFEIGFIKSDVITPSSLTSADTNTNRRFIQKFALGNNQRQPTYFEITNDDADASSGSQYFPCVINTSGSTQSLRFCAIYILG